MTNSQTIDGVLVSRELLEVMLTAHQSWPSYDKARKELRALLDAPAVESELSRMTRRCQNAELALKVQTENYEALKAVQAQGEPVAWAVNRGGVLELFNSEGEALDDLKEWRKNAPPHDVSVGPVRLYAEQPAPVAVVPKSECPNCLGDAMFGCDTCTPDPVAVEYKLHMGDALKVFEALKADRISRKIEQEDLGPMGATEIETWSTSIGVTLEMHTAMGGCTLIVRTATVSVVMPDPVDAQDFGDESMANGWNACIDEVTRLNIK